eukprot:Platyproteum_vivax@DN14777_c0_g1_i1.p1
MEAAIVSHIINEPHYRPKPILTFDGKDYTETLMTPSEETAHLINLLKTSLHVFLERYGSLLQTTHLSWIESNSTITPEVEFYLNKYRTATTTPNKTQIQIRNRRYRKLQNMKASSTESEYWTMSSMKEREPALFKLVCEDSTYASIYQNPVYQNPIKNAGDGAGPVSSLLLESMNEDICREDMQHKDKFRKVDSIMKTIKKKQDAGWGAVVEDRETGDGDGETHNNNNIKVDDNFEDMKMGGGEEEEDENDLLKSHK